MTTPTGQPPFPGRPQANAPYQGFQHPGQPGQHSARATKGFMASLFDFNFDHFIAPKLVKFIYIILVVLLTIGALIMAISSIGLMATGDTGAVFGLLGLIAAPLFWLLGLMAYRVSLELMVVAFKISEDLRAIRLGSGTLR